jgi:hypothetical protein
VPPVGFLPLSMYNWPGALPDAPGLPVAGGVPLLTDCWPGETVEAPWANATGDDAINKPPMAANGRALIMWVSFCFLDACDFLHGTRLSVGQKRD